MQNKKIISILIIVMMIAFVVPQVTLASWWNPFSWGFWNKILNWKVQNPAVEKTIGGDKGSNGCLIAAGYSWCEIKNKCLRTWEEKCEIELKPDFSFSIIGKNIQIKDKTTKGLVQEIPLGYDYLAIKNLPINQVINFKEDINFDGYNDLSIMRDVPASNSPSYGYFIYNLSTKKFEQVKDLKNLSSPIFNSNDKTITTYNSGGCAGGYFSKATFSFLDGKYVLTETKEGNCCSLSGVQEGNGVKITEYKNGKIKTTRTDFCPK